MSYDTCYEELKALRVKHGTSQFDYAVKKLMRERIDSGRDKREKFPKSMYQKLFDTQKGICPGYDTPPHPLTIPAVKNEIDHIDPDRIDFNHRTNLQLLCVDCNRRKSSKSIAQQAKETGRPYTRILVNDDENE